MAELGYVIISSKEYKDLILKEKELEETQNLYFEKDKELFNANKKISYQQAEQDKLLSLLIKDRKIYDKVETFNIANDDEIANYLNENYLKEIRKLCEED